MPTPLESTPFHVEPWGFHDDPPDVPPHEWKKYERECEARAFKPRDENEVKLAVALKEEINRSLPGYLRRRDAENRVADALERDGIYPEYVERLRGCRRHAVCGVHVPSGRQLRLWEDKCGLLLLCPDEAREETHRLADRYVPAMTAWLMEKPGLRSPQYCVLSWPNVPREQLARYQRLMFKHLSRWLKSKPLRAVKGALTVMESPLAADGDWNVHVNLLLCVEGYFNWGQARAKWFAMTRHLFDKRHRDFQVYFKPVDRGRLVQSLMELVKYSAKHIDEDGDDEEKESARPVPIRSEGEAVPCDGAGSDAADGRDGAGTPSDVPSHLHAHERRPAAGDAGAVGADVPGRQPRVKAPAFVRWPAERKVEWVEAHQRFRRTRSYGVLFKTPKVEREKISYEDVLWIGVLRYSASHGYVFSINPGAESAISSIPGDKSQVKKTGPPTSWTQLDGETQGIASAGNSIRLKHRFSNQPLAG